MCPCETKCRLSPNASLFIKKKRSDDFEFVQPLETSKSGIVLITVRSAWAHKTVPTLLTLAVTPAKAGVQGGVQCA